MNSNINTVISSREDQIYQRLQTFSQGFAAFISCHIRALVLNNFGIGVVKNRLLTPKLHIYNANPIRQFFLFAANMS